MQDNIRKVVNNALTVKKENIDRDKIINIINRIKESLIESKELFNKACQIDINNNNGFKINYDTIDKIFDNVLKERIVYGEVISSEKDSEKNIIYGKQIMDRGIVSIITEGNFYIVLEIILRNILAFNTIILNITGYMYGANNLLIEIIKTVLEKYNISKYLLQIIVNAEFEYLLSNYSSLNLVIAIGNRDLQQKVLEISQNKTIVSGYNNYDLYIEDTQNLEFISKILDSDASVQLYIKNNLKTNYHNAILVEDIDEAIAQINYNGSSYNISIFTESKENASKFLREVKANTVLVNTSPTIDRICDIKQIELVREVKIVYPIEFKFNKKI